MNINIMETKTITFEELLALIPNNAQTWHFGRTFDNLSDYIIDNHDGNVSEFGLETSTFDQRQIALIENWDYSMVEPLYLTKLPKGIHRVRDGSHRCIIIATLVKRGIMDYQSISVEITDHALVFANIIDWTTFLNDSWLPFYSVEPWTSNLRVKLFDSDIIQESLDLTVVNLKEQMQRFLNAQSDGLRNRIIPITIKCHWRSDATGKSRDSDWITI